MFDDDIVHADFHDKIEDVYDLLEQKNQQVDNFARLLHKSWKSQFLTKEEEAKIWSEFMDMPASFMHYMLAYKRIRNEGAFMIGFSDDDITIAHKTLRYLYSLEIWPDQIDLTISQIKGLIIALAIQKHLLTLEPNEQHSRKDSVSLLSKVRLLYELGFFEGLKKRGINEYGPIGSLLSLLIGGDEDTMRRMAANSMEPNSDGKKGCNPFSPKTEKEIIDILNRLYPKLYPKAK